MSIILIISNIWSRIGSLKQVYLRGQVDLRSQSLKDYVKHKLLLAVLIHPTIIEVKLSKTGAIPVSEHVGFFMFHDLTEPSF